MGARNDDRRQTDQNGEQDPPGDPPNQRAAAEGPQGDGRHRGDQLGTQPSDELPRDHLGTGAQHGSEHSEDAQHCCRQECKDEFRAGETLDRLPTHDSVIVCWIGSSLLMIATVSQAPMKSRAVAIAARSEKRTRLCARHCIHYGEADQGRYPALTSKRVTIRVAEERPQLRMPRRMLAPRTPPTSPVPTPLEGSRPPCHSAP